MTPLDRMKAMAAQESKLMRRRFGIPKVSVNHKTTDEVVERRAKVKALFDEGMKPTEAARNLGLSYTVVKKDFEVLRRAA